MDKLAPGPAVPHRAGGRPFVGRAPELVELRAGLDETAEGRGALFLLSGEPGIGKTRLMQELSREAAERGWRTAAGRCWEEGGAPVYWPWIQAVRALGGDFEQFAGATPESVDPETARFRLFDAVAEFLVETARKRPLIVVLDDLHAADAGSLVMLRFVSEAVSDAPVLIVGSYREREAQLPERAESFAGLVRVATRVSLQGLSADEVGAYLGDVTGDQAPPTSWPGSTCSPAGIRSSSVRSCGWSPTIRWAGSLRSCGRCCDGGWRTCPTTRWRRSTWPPSSGASSTSECSSVRASLASRDCSTCSRRPKRPAWSQRTRPLRAATRSSTSSFARRSTTTSPPRSGSSCTARSAACSRSCTATTSIRTSRRSPTTWHWPRRSGTSRGRWTTSCGPAIGPPAWSPTRRPAGTTSERSAWSAPPRRPRASCAASCSCASATLTGEPATRAPRAAASSRPRRWPAAWATARCSPARRSAT